MRRLCFPIVVTVLLALAGPAGAQATGLDAAAQALRSDTVFVDPVAERAGDVSAGRLRDRIRSGGSPIFVAVLPAAASSETGGEPGLLPSALGRKVGFKGTYAVLAGNSFRAASNVLPAGQAETLATRAFQARTSDDPEPVLEDFIARVNQVGAGSGGGSGSGGSRGSGTTSGSSAGLLALLAVGGGGLFLWSRSRRRRQDAERRKELAADRQLLQAELSVLGDDVLALEPDVTVHPDARADYDAGVTRFKSAQAALEYADHEVDLVRVGRVIEEGRYAMARARAVVQGRQPPPPPPELTRPGRRNEPALDVDDAGSVRYAGYADMPFYGGGWFGGGGGGLLTGLLLGQMMGGGGWGWGGGGWYDRGMGSDDDGRGDDGGGYDGGDGGDFGGGDFGGGDFGGGDFGGGDFGGGDF